MNHSLAYHSDHAPWKPEPLHDLRETETDCLWNIEAPRLSRGVLLLGATVMQERKLRIDSRNAKIRDDRPPPRFFNLPAEAV